MAEMGDECRQRGLREIRKVRETIDAARRVKTVANPFDHSRDDECGVCGGPCVKPARRRPAA